MDENKDYVLSENLIEYDPSNFNTSTEDEDISYNYFLYKKRLEHNLSIRKFAKLLKISKFRYKLIENGYIKPSKKDIKKINDYFNIDFNYYLESIRSYPTELDNKKYLKITNFLYHIFNYKKTRITLLVITLLSLISFIVSFAIVNHYDSSRIRAYEPKVKEFNDALIEKGDVSFSLFDFTYPEISKNIDMEGENERSVIISSKYNSSLLAIDFETIIWYGNYRFILSYEEITNGIIHWDVDQLEYDRFVSYGYEVTELNGTFYVPEASNTGSKVLLELLNGYEFDIYEDFDTLIKEKLDLNYTFTEITSSISETKKIISTWEIPLLLITAFSLITFLFFFFVFCYASIYRKNKDERIIFNHSDELFGIRYENKPVKKDMRFFPFIPETLIRILGIILVIIGSGRLIIYAQIAYSYSDANIAQANSYYSIQLIGMFIIFFLNFDIYMDDTRLFRNLLLYPMAFFMIYLVEAGLMNSIMAEKSILSLSLARVTLPNPFSSATCYFLLMFFLFFTPNYIKSKKKLIIFRSLAIIPILFIIVSFILGNLDTLFNYKYDGYWFKYFFRGDRFSISLLAISYLVSLFFLRLFYKKKYGEKNAFKLFMGNKYLFIKNILACGLVTIIWIFELIFAKNDLMNKLGIGLNTHLIILVPILLLYHPHKNARNTKVDVTLITIYIALLTIIYLATGVTALISFGS